MPTKSEVDLVKWRDSGHTWPSFSCVEREKMLVEFQFFPKEDVEKFISSSQEKFSQKSINCDSFLTRYGWRLLA